LFAYGPADASASPKPSHLLPYLNPDCFYVSGTGLPRMSWKRLLDGCSECPIKVGAIDAAALGPFKK